MADRYKDRQFNESPWEQGANEEVKHPITIPTTWGTSSFTNITCTLYEDPSGDNTDVSSTKLSGTASASGQVITTQTISGLTAGTDYRLVVKFTASEGNVLEGWGIIRGTQ